MFCPKCATDNLDNASFCRKCGANISLVPHALTGQLPVQEQPAALDPEDEDNRGRRRRGRKDSSSMDKGIKNIFMGVGFLFVALALSTSQMGMMWWYWMLIPAFAMMGGGVGEIIRARQKRNITPATNTYVPTMTAVPPSPRMNTLTPRNTAELVPPPSVTEGTTRHLSVEAPTRHFDTPVEKTVENS